MCLSEEAEEEIRRIVETFSSNWDSAIKIFPFTEFAIGLTLDLPLSTFYIMADIPTSYPQQQPEWTICSSLSSPREKVEFDDQDCSTFMKNLTIGKQLIAIVSNLCVKHYLPIPPELISLDPDFANLVLSAYETVYTSPEDNMKLLKEVALNFEQEWRNRWNLQLKDFENRYIELSKQGCQCDFDVKRKSFEQQMDHLEQVLLNQTVIFDNSSKDDNNSSKVAKADI
ncbi:hypothetical protein Aperf_G00000066144 [Anoplocephala perfoliata]